QRPYSSLDPKTAEYNPKIQHRKRNSHDTVPSLKTTVKKAALWENAEKRVQVEADISMILTTERMPGHRGVQRHS
ncbi:hypothetical protein AVEN_30395-1, partial [Araneus ventricosus]